MDNLTLGSANHTHPSATKWKVNNTPIASCIRPKRTDPDAGGLPRLKVVQRLWMNNPNPCQAPQMAKFQVTPCHRPINVIVANCPSRMTSHVNSARQSSLARRG